MYRIIMVHLLSGGLDKICKPTDTLNLFYECNESPQYCRCFILRTVAHMASAPFSLLLALKVNKNITVSRLLCSRPARPQRGIMGKLECNVTPTSVRWWQGCAELNSIEAVISCNLQATPPRWPHYSEFPSHLERSCFPLTVRATQMNHNIAIMARSLLVCPPSAR